jgi:iron complex transport system substrate-binding protein
MKIIRAALLCGAAATAHAAADAMPPTVASTNVCADVLALALTDKAQLLSVSAQSHDPRVSPMPEQAAAFPANRATAEEIIALHPDIVLASKRWPGRHQEPLLTRHGTRIGLVPYPLTWEAVFESTHRIGGWLQRDAAADALVADVQQRLQRLQAKPRPYRVLHVRPNGRCAGKGTQVDMVFAAIGVTNHADALGCVGWGQLSLETLLANPPDIFVVADGVRREQAHAHSFQSRHPLMRRLMAMRPVLHVSSTHWGCSNWLLIEAAEKIAAQIDRLPDRLPGSTP